MRPGSREHWAYVRQLLIDGKLEIPRGGQVDWLVEDDIELSHGKPIIIVDGDRRFMLEELPAHETPSWVLVGKLACQAVAPITFVP